MSAGLLTERTIAALRPIPGRQYMHWDTTLKGFGIRISPSGVKTYTLKYRLRSGRSRWKTLGRVGAIALDQARRFAKEDIGLVARGLDPLAPTDAARGALTVAIVAQRFLTDYVTPRKKPGTLRSYRLAIDRHITPQLGSMPIADVDTDHVVKLHQRLQTTPYLANRVVACLSKLLAWSMTAKFRPAGWNPCRGIEKFHERRRKRYLAEDEYNRLGQALRTSTMSPAPRTAIELLLLTGARPDEICTLEWTHVDLQDAALRLPDSKTGEKTIHLSPPALKLLKGWPRFAASPYVFPGTGKHGGTHLHASTLSHLWVDLRTAAQLDDVRLYDAARHSYASVAVSRHGLTLAAIGEQLGHSQPATTSRYAHLHDDVKKENATAIGNTIAASLSRRPARR